MITGEVDLFAVIVKSSWTFNDMKHLSKDRLTFVAIIIFRLIFSSHLFIAVTIYDVT